MTVSTVIVGGVVAVEATVLLPAINDFELIKVSAPLIADSNPFTVEARASDCRLINLGAAVTAKIPKIIITTTNSIKVKPLCFFI